MRVRPQQVLVGSGKSGPFCEISKRLELILLAIMEFPHILKLTCSVQYNLIWILYFENFSVKLIVLRNQFSVLIGGYKVGLIHER